MKIPLGILLIAAGAIGGYFIITGKFPPSGSAQLATEAGPVVGQQNAPAPAPGGGGFTGGNLTPGIGDGGVSVYSAARGLFR